MKTIMGSICVAILAVGVGGEASIKKETAKLQGTWTVSHLTYNGNENEKLKLTFTFKGDEAVIEGDESVKKEYARIKVKIDPTTTPKIMDITIAAGIQKDSVIEGIYEFKGDDLRICAKVFGKDRPAEFASADGSSVVLITLKRTQP